MRTVLCLAFLLFIAGCGGDDPSRAVATTADGISLEVSGVPVEQTKVWAAEKPGGPPRGWFVGRSPEFFIDTPPQTVDDPAELTFTLDADSMDDFTRGRVDQLGVFLPGGLFLGPGNDLTCPASGRAEPDPCIASAEFLDNGDGRIVVLASDPSTG
ncbi:MAG: hypothetical protein ABWY96_11265 [Gaiellaceae bacterium]